MCVIFAAAHSAAPMDALEAIVLEGEPEREPKERERRWAAARSCRARRRAVA